MSTIYKNMISNTIYVAPQDWIQIKTIDMHTGGEPVRVIISGFPELKGTFVLEYSRDIKENYDYLRTALMFEPHGQRICMVAFCFRQMTKRLILASCLCTMKDTAPCSSLSTY